jgi:hypothetical protein
MGIYGNVWQFKWENMLNHGFLGTSFLGQTHVSRLGLEGSRRLVLAPSLSAKQHGFL